MGGSKYIARLRESRVDASIYLISILNKKSLAVRQGFPIFYQSLPPQFCAGRSHQPMKGGYGELHPRAVSLKSSIGND